MNYYARNESAMKLSIDSIALYTKLFEKILMRGLSNYSLRQIMPNYIKMQYLTSVQQNSGWHDIASRDLLLSQAKSRYPGSNCDAGLRSETTLRMENRASENIASLSEIDRSRRSDYAIVISCEFTH